MLALLIRRDLRQAWASAGLWLPVAFLLLVASLYPFAVGPDAALLGRTGGGILWIAALLASLLPVDRLVAPDAQAGILDQIALRGIGEEMVVTARLVAHWLGFGPPLILATLPAAALLKIVIIFSNYWMRWADRLENIQNAKRGLWPLFLLMRLKLFSFLC